MGRMLGGDRGLTLEVHVGMVEQQNAHRPAVVGINDAGASVYEVLAGKA